MIEDEIIKLYRRCDPERQDLALKVLTAGGVASEYDAEERHEAKGARVILFKPREARNQ